MHAFKDNKSRTWELTITVADLDRVLKGADFDLTAVLKNDYKPLLELLDDPRKLTGVLWTLCEKQAEKLRVEPEEFGSGLAGDVLEAAWTAFKDELLFFIPNRSRRENIAATINAGLEAAMLFYDTANAKLNGLDRTELANQVLLQNRNGLSKPSLDSPLKSAEPSALTPAPSASGN